MSETVIADAVMTIPSPEKVFLLSFVLPLLAVLGLSFLLWKLISKPRSKRAIFSYVILALYYIFSNYLKYVISAWLLQASQVADTAPYFLEVVTVAGKSSLFWFFGDMVAILILFVASMAIGIHFISRLRKIAKQIQAQIRAFMRRRNQKDLMKHLGGQ